MKDWLAPKTVKNRVMALLNSSILAELLSLRMLLLLAGWS